jgi:hypothetical protein
MPPDESSESDTDYALRLLARTMRDEELPIGFRLDAAREVLDRTRGRPRQAAEPARTGHRPMIQIVQVNRPGGSDGGRQCDDAVSGFVLDDVSGQSNVKTSTDTTPNDL